MRVVYAHLLVYRIVNMIKIISRRPIHIDSKLGKSNTGRPAIDARLITGNITFTSLHGTKQPAGLHRHSRGSENPQECIRKDRTTTPSRWQSVETHLCRQRNPWCIDYLCRAPPLCLNTSWVLSNCDCRRSTHSRLTVVQSLKLLSCCRIYPVFLRIRRSPLLYQTCLQYSFIDHS